MLVVGWTHDDLSPTIELDLIWQVSQIFIFANFLPGHDFNLAHLSPKKRQKAGKRKPNSETRKARPPPREFCHSSFGFLSSFVIWISFVIRHLEFVISSSPIFRVFS